jgi:hypothetical protein
VILMPIVSRMSENNIGLELARHLFECLFDFAELNREETVSESMNAYSIRRRTAKKFASASRRFALARSGCTPDNPPKLGSRPSCSQAEQRRTTTDFDVVRMGAQTEHSEPLPAGSAKAQPE